MTIRVKPVEVNAQKPKKPLLFLVYQILCIKHWFIAGILLVVTFGGAFIIWRHEKPAEEEQVIRNHQAIEAQLAILAVQIKQKLQAVDVTEADIEKYLTDAYVRMEKKEGIYKGSALHKNENMEENMMWRFWPAVFYASNIYMTVGYGVVHCNTSLGQFLSIVYGFIAIPFALVVVRDLAQWILVNCTRFYARCVMRYRKDNGQPVTDEEEFSLPFIFIALIFFANWLLVSFCTYLYDAYWVMKWGDRNEDSQDYFSSMYYTWITITSMGMSDDMPYHCTVLFTYAKGCSQSSPMLTVWMFLGLPCFKIGCRAFYLAMENGLLGSLAVLEHKLGKTTKVDDSSESTIEAAQPKEYATEEEQQRIDENVKSFTFGAIPGFMRSRADAYAGQFGRISIRNSK